MSPLEKCTDREVFIVAEIGNNHEGNFDLAIEMVEAAAKTGVDAVKFQTFIPERYVSSADAGRLERLKKFRLSKQQHYDLAKKAKELNLIFFSTPFDLESAIFLNQIQSIFKISSGDNNFTPLIELIASFNKRTIISSGLSDLNSLKKLVDLWHRVGGRDENLSILHCVSSYPVPKEQANIASIHSLRRAFPDITIGYSDHTLGSLASILAVAAGARIIEKHFTLNKKQSDFRDHQLSADPVEMRNLVEQIRETSELMGKEEKNLQNCELENVVSMRRSIAASKIMRTGKIIEVSDLTWVRPGSGIPIGLESDVIGRIVLSDILQGELITKEKIA